MQALQKRLYFEYVLHKLLEWHHEKTGREEPNDLGVLKSIKLLFFVSAAKTSIGNDNSLLDLVFDKFSAMPYGHVESEVYSEIVNKTGNLKYFEIDNNG